MEYINQETTPENALAANWQAERLNVFTHAFGLAAGLVGAPILLYFAWPQVTGAQWIGLLIFCLSMLTVYAASTFYHAAWAPDLKRRLHLADHISIYFLIAGTHTPLLLLFLDNALGSLYLGLIWVLVAVGVFYKLFFFGRWPWVSLALYLGMGWLGVLTVPAMLHQMDTVTLAAIIFGGLSYTAGIPFFTNERLPYAHALWHLFVMGGTAAHFAAVWTAVLGA